MNGLPPREDPPDDIDDRYRRAAAADTSRPSEAVRRAVLDHAGRLARSRRAWRRLPIVGTLAAAALAGVLVTPRLFESPVAPAPVPAAVREPAAPPAATAPPGPRPAGFAALREASPSPAPAPRARAPLQPQPQARFQSPPQSAQAQPQLQSQGQPQLQSQAPAQPQSQAHAQVPGQLRAVTAAAAPAAGRADGTQALRQAAEIGDTARVQALLDQQVDIDARDADGQSALLLATRFGRRDAVDLLLAHGADPNAADALGMTPLQAAVAGDDPQIAAALRRAGAR
ncbi:MAG: ankyrin repeat domain-containing protein [Steroidobacteraceae bacterium]